MCLVWLCFVLLWLYYQFIVDSYDRLIHIFRVAFGTGVIICRADSRFGPSQWETSLQSNAVSHWLGANQESALIWIAMYKHGSMWTTHRSHMKFVGWIQGPLLPTEICQHNTELGAWISDNIHTKLWDTITHPCYNSMVAQLNNYWS